MCAALVDKVPENTLGHTGGSGRKLARQTVCDIIAGEHEAPYLGVDLRFVALDPGQLGSREVARGVEQVRHASVVTDGLKGFRASRDGTGVAPYDGIAYGTAVLANGHEAVHLVRDTDGDGHFNLGIGR